MNKEDYTLKNGVLVIKDGVESIEKRAFEFKQIKELYLNNSVKRIEWNAFNGNRIKELHLFNSVESIGYSVFANNEIEHLNLCNKIKYVSYNAFENNPLKTITFKGVTYNIKIVDNWYFVTESTKIINNIIICNGWVFYGIDKNKIIKKYCSVVHLENGLSSISIKTSYYP